MRQSWKEGNGVCGTQRETDILALEEESKILGRCWALSEFHISSRSFSNQFLNTVGLWGDAHKLD